MEIGVYFNYRERGPGKVVDSLLSGFEKLNIKYKINSDGDRNLILQDCDRLRGDLSNCLLGPNICTLPVDNQYVMNYNSYRSLIVPSEWVKNLYKRWIPENKIKIWASGIDTHKFSDRSNFEKKYDFLIYFKRRSNEDLNEVIKLLNNKNQSFQVIEYGSYNEKQFIDSISSSRYGIILDNTESQGVAIEEMLSCNLPLLVWDVTHWTDRGEEYKVESTSVPYWDERCGVKFTDLTELEDSYLIFLEKIDTFVPREFALNNLSLEICSKKIITELNE